MNQADRDYYLERIAEEKLAAQRATHPSAARCHQQLAEEYASLIIANHQPIMADADQAASRRALKA